MITKKEINKRHHDENEWQNKSADIMAMQWEMTPWLNKVLRKDFINDIKYGTPLSWDLIKGIEEK